MQQNSHLTIYGYIEVWILNPVFTRTEYSACRRGRTTPCWTSLWSRSGSTTWRPASSTSSTIPGGQRSHLIFNKSQRWYFIMPNKLELSHFKDIFDIIKRHMHKLSPPKCGSQYSWHSMVLQVASVTSLAGRTLHNALAGMVILLIARCPHLIGGGRVGVPSFKHNFEYLYACSV